MRVFARFLCCSLFDCSCLAVPEFDSCVFAVVHLLVCVFAWVFVVLLALNSGYPKLLAQGKWEATAEPPNHQSKPPVAGKRINRTDQLLIPSLFSAFFSLQWEHGLGPGVWLLSSTAMLGAHCESSHIVGIGVVLVIPSNLLVAEHVCF